MKDKKKGKPHIVGCLSLAYTTELRVEHSEHDFETIRFMLDDKEVFSIYAETLEDINSKVQAAINEKRHKKRG